MSQKFENLSALVDGEKSTTNISDSAVIDAVKNDVDLMQKWKSYHLIRDSLRQELPKQINFDIAAKVALALQSEPAILAPKKTWRDLPIVASIVPFAKQGGQMAIAASVAVAMIIGVQQVNQPAIELPFNAAPPILGVQGGLSPVSFDNTRAMPRTDVIEQRRRMNAYVADHNQQMRFKSTQSLAEVSLIEKQIIEIEEAQTDIVENTPE
jgi:sigma-E factor negative regulatory protein RseA